MALLVGLASLTEAANLVVNGQGWRDAFAVGHYGAALGTLAAPLIGFFVALVLWPEKRARRD